MLPFFPFFLFHSLFLFLSSFLPPSLPSFPSPSTPVSLSFPPPLWCVCAPLTIKDLYLQRAVLGLWEQTQPCHIHAHREWDFFLTQLSLIYEDYLHSKIIHFCFYKYRIKIFPFHYWFWLMVYYALKVFMLGRFQKDGRVGSTRNLSPQLNNGIVLCNCFRALEPGEGLQLLAEDPDGKLWLIWALSAIAPAQPPNK